MGEHSPPREESFAVVSTALFFRVVETPDSNALKCLRNGFDGEGHSPSLCNAAAWRCVMSSAASVTRSR